ncbi:MAG: hypothetical protein H6735_21730 [Alphaproteobacteria bacterium]|nr:hypothetical protein [Alphaproteobacteria bacterium]
MWWMLAAQAEADVAFTTGSTCGIAELGSTMPADGDTDVLPDAVITIVHELAEGSRPCGGGFFEGELSGEQVGPVAFTLTADPAQMVFTLVPEEPLVVGETYQLQGNASGGPVSIRFTVGEGGLEMTEPPSDVQLDANVQCGAFSFTTLDHAIQFDRPRRGLLQTQVLTDGISAGWQTRAAIDGRTEYTGTTDVLGGGHEYCLGVRLVDELGEVVWEVDGGCVSTDPCPPEQRTGGGCSTVGGGLGAPWLGVLVLSLSRRRKTC